jgi:potassium-transporting ATPase potassium-binding subunit
MAMLFALIFPADHPGADRISSVEPFGTSSIANPGPHGLSQILYAFTEAAGTTDRPSAG